MQRKEEKKASAECEGSSPDEVLNLFYTIRTSEPLGVWCVVVSPRSKVCRKVSFEGVEKNDASVRSFIISTELFGYFIYDRG